MKEEKRQQGLGSSGNWAVERGHILYAVGIDLQFKQSDMRIEVPPSVTTDAMQMFQLSRSIRIERAYSQSPGPLRIRYAKNPLMVHPCGGSPHANQIL